MGSNQAIFLITFYLFISFSIKTDHGCNLKLDKALDVLTWRNVVRALRRGPSC